MGSFIFNNVTEDNVDESVEALRIMAQDALDDPRADADEKSKAEQILSAPREQLRAALLEKY